HFMYYDVLLTALPVLLLLTEPGRFLRPTLVGVLSPPDSDLGCAVVQYFQPRLVRTYPSSQVTSDPALHRIGVLNSLTLSLLVLLVIAEFLFPFWSISVSVFVPGLTRSSLPMPLKFSTSLAGTPWTTFCLIALWLWCGWLWLRLPQPRPGNGWAPSDASI